MLCEKCKQAVRSSLNEDGHCRSCVINAKSDA